MTDISQLPRLYAEWLVDEVNKSQNTYELIKYLRSGGEVTPKLAILIADILEGKTKAKLKYPKHRDLLKPINLKLGVEFFRKLIKKGGDPSIVDIRQLKKMLAKAGYKGNYPDSKGEITKAAKHLEAMMWGLTQSQFSELIHPRSARKKTA